MNADTETTLLQELGCWGEKVACGRKEIKTKIHAEQILDYINK